MGYAWCACGRLWCVLGRSGSREAVSVECKGNGGALLADEISGCLHYESELG